MKIELNLKGLKDEINGAIALLVNSGYRVHWETVKVGNVKSKVLIVEDKKGEEK